MNTFLLPPAFERLKFGQVVSLFFAVSIAAGYVLHSVDGSALQHHRHRTPPPGLMVGTYQGSVLEGGPLAISSDPGVAAVTVGFDGLSNDPVETKFSRLNGVVVGEYTIREPGQQYSGQLVQRGPLRDHAATFDWSDKFGHGTVEMKFDGDYCSFDGRWRNAEGTMIDEPWTGRRR